MKKMWMIAAVVCAAFMVACENPEQKAKTYSDQMKKAKTSEEFQKISDEAEQYREGLSSSDKKIFDEALEIDRAHITKKQVELEVPITKELQE